MANFLLKNFGVDVLQLSICLILVVQATNLLSGGFINSQQKLISHPVIVLISSRGASDLSLFLASIVLRGIGSFWSNGLEHVSNIRMGALMHRMRLSDPSMSTVSDTRLLIKISFVPLGSMSMSTISSRLLQRGCCCLTFLLEGPDVGFFQRALMDSNRCCVVSLLLDRT